MGVFWVGWNVASFVPEVLQKKWHKTSWFLQSTVVRMCCEIVSFFFFFLQLGVDDADSAQRFQEWVSLVVHTESSSRAFTYDNTGGRGGFRVCITIWSSTNTRQSKQHYASAWHGTRRLHRTICQQDYLCLFVGVGRVLVPVLLNV